MPTSHSSLIAALNEAHQRIHPASPWRPGDPAGVEEDMVRLLARALDDADPAVVGAAAAALDRIWNDVVTVLAEGTSDEPRAIEVLLRIADDPLRPRAVRDETLLALCRLEAPEAIDLLGRALLDPDVAEATRRRCADALGEIGNYGALDALEAAARSDPDGGLGWHARDAIANILHGGSDVSGDTVPLACVVLVT